MSLFDSASVIITPNAYKEDKLYSIKPTDGSGDLVVTRATTATRVNSAGLVELVPYNLLTYSEQFDNAAWIKIGSTITANSVVAPNGTTTADKFESSSAGIPEIVQTTSNTNVKTISFYAKAGNVNFISLWIGSDVKFDLSTGTVVTGTATIENVGNGWYRCVVSNTTYTNFNPFFSATASGQFVYLWGAQLVDGTSAKEYFPTTDRLNVPRIDYTNGSCPSILVEPQRTNLVLYSEQFDNAVWISQNVSLTANNTTSPSGNLDADLVNVSATNGEHNVYNLTPIVITPNVDYTFSYFVKKGTGRYACVVIYYAGVGGGFGPYATYDLNTNTLVASGAIVGTFTSSKLETFPNGWVKISVTGKGNFISAVIAPDFRNAANLIPGWTFTGTNETYSIWGAQLELGSYATSYIPTVASSVTRNADVISKTGISSLIGQTEGTLFVDFIAPDGIAPIILNLATSNQTYLESIYLEYDPSVSSLSLRIWTNGSLVGGVTKTSIIKGNRYKVAVSYKANDTAMYINGSLVSGLTQPNAIQSNLSEIYIGNLAGLTGNATFTGAIVSATAIWKTLLTNTQLAQLTTI